MNTKHNARPKIAILDDYYSRASAYADWENTTDADFTFFSDPFLSEQAVVEALTDFNAVGLMRERTPFPATVIKQMPKLELIVTSGKKNASIDVAAAHAQGITVCGTDSPGHATAELAMLLVMSLQRQLVPLVNALQQKGEWQPHLGTDIRGRTLGILGLGRLGSQLAGFAKAMGMHVLAWSENLTAESCNTQGVEYVTREELFKQADVVSIHLRHSDRSHNMVNLEDLELLGPQGYLVNTSRAEIVNLKHLKHALDNHIIAGAAVDVFPEEPCAPTHWLVNHPRILPTPHIGYCTEETFQVFYQQTLEAFQAYYNGAPIRVLTS